MDTRHLIDSIVRQTTILIAQLATTAGIRAPLARIADQVFFELAREIEAQGVRRKVVADMFGIALRSYQKKINRLTESRSFRERTLWEAILEYAREQGTIGRDQILHRFRRDDASDVASVLVDLVSTGLLQARGKGREVEYAPSTERDFRELRQKDELETVTNLVWLVIYDEQPISRKALLDKLEFDRELSDRAIDVLIEDGRVTKKQVSGAETLHCSRLVIPVGAEKGWEAAVYDHFHTMAAAIGTKLRTNRLKSRADDIIGGTTLSFTIYPGHPFEKDVLGLLGRIRKQVNPLWNKVSSYNEEHPEDSAEKLEVSFYFGQSVIGLEDNEIENGDNNA
jgi:hypothetical protein